MVAHGDGGVLVHHADGDALFGAKPAHPCSVTGIELPLPGLNAPSAAQERVLIDHHLVACNVCEVQVVHLYNTHVQTHTTKRQKRQTNRQQKCILEYISTTMLDFVGAHHHIPDPVV